MFAQCKAANIDQYAAEVHQWDSIAVPGRNLFLLQILFEHRTMLPTRQLAAFPTGAHVHFYALLWCESVTVSCDRLKGQVAVTKGHLLTRRQRNSALRWTAARDQKDITSIAT